MIIVDQAYSGKTLDLPIGEVMEVRLAENPTTGYRWSIVVNGAPACAMLSDRFEHPSGPPGRGGEHTWHIKGVVAGECDITMLYRRSFEPNAVGQSFALHVRVTQ
jgi:inhibitor of cysteine peptidase